jgi:hypothetical protein
MLDRLAYAKCECGWRSPSYINAGLAGAAWDEHVEAATGEAAPSNPVVLELARLEALRTAGVVDEVEFEAKKAALLKRL